MREIKGEGYFDYDEVTELRKEVERLKKELEENECSYQKLFTEYKETRKEIEDLRFAQSKMVERFKKEHGEQLMYAIHRAEKMGERLALNKVNQAMANSCRGEGVFDKTYFYEELYRLGDDANKEEK